MMDWQSYIDGSMPAAERAALEGRMALEPKLRAELEGFKSFQSALREAGQSVVVPNAALQTALAGVAAKGSPIPWMRMRWSLGAVAASILILFAWFMVTRDPMALANSRMRDSFPRPTAEQASAWVYNKIGLLVPPIPMTGSGAILERTAVGDDWAMFEYSVQGDHFSIYVKSGDNFDSFPKTEGTEGTPQFVGPKGTGWRANGLSYYLTGSEEMVSRMNCEATKESLVPPKKPRLGVKTK